MFRCSRSRLFDFRAMTHSAIYPPCVVGSGRNPYLGTVVMSNGTLPDPLRYAKAVNWTVRDAIYTYAQSKFQYCMHIRRTFCVHTAQYAQASPVSWIIIRFPNFASDFNPVTKIKFLALCWVWMRSKPCWRHHRIAGSYPRSIAKQIPVPSTCVGNCTPSICMSNTCTCVSVLFPRYI